LVPAAPAHSERRYLRTAAAADYLGVGVRSLRDPNWRARNRVPHARVGDSIIYDRLALDAWIAKRTTNATNGRRR
jgi:hypothetical protein